MSLPKISVVVPVYNVEQYLPECLNSLITQTLKEIEIICINDGSTDSSSAILEKYAMIDSRILVFSQKNSGLSAARNAGSEKATGKYLYFLDSDDLLATPEALANMYDALEANNLDVLYINGKLYFDFDRTVYDFHPVDCFRNGTYPLLSSGPELFNLMYTQNDYRVGVAMQIIRTDFLRSHALSFIPGIIHEDVPFAFKVILNASRAGYLPETYYLYRIRPNSITTKPLSQNNLIGYYRSCLDMLQFYNLFRITNGELESINNYLFDFAIVDVKVFYLGLGSPPVDSLSLSAFEKNLFNLLVAQPCANSTLQNTIHALNSDIQSLNCEVQSLNQELSMKKHSFFTYKLYKKILHVLRK